MLSIQSKIPKIKKSNYVLPLIPPKVPSVEEEKEQVHYI
jgi:hypothetical protein